MSGKKQHIIPQFIQKKFSNNGQLHYHSKDKCYTSAIKDIYAENLYYSEKGGFLDNKITELEFIYSKNLNELIKIEEDKEFLINEITSKFLFHLFTRNKTTYNFIRNIALYLLEEIIEKIKCNYIESYNTYIEKYKKMGISRDIILNNFNFFIEKVKKEYIKEVEKLKTKLNYKSVDGDKYTFIKSFKCKIIKGENFILPDILFISYSKKCGIKPLIDIDTEYIIMPISNKKSLILYKENVDLINVNEDFINDALIRASFNSFLSNINFKREKDKCIIRSNSFYKEIEEIITQTIKTNKIKPRVIFKTIKGEYEKSIKNNNNIKLY